MGGGSPREVPWLEGVPAEVLLLILKRLGAPDLGACLGVNRRLRTLASGDTLWRPLALWLPGLAVSLAAPPMPAVTSWRRVVAHWHMTCEARIARRKVVELRQVEKDLFNRSRYHAEELRRRIRTAQSCQRSHDEAEQARQRLLAAHALWRMDNDGRRSDWGLTRPASPPTDSELESAGSYLQLRAEFLLAADASVAEQRAIVHDLAATRERAQQQRRQATVELEDAEDSRRWEGIDAGDVGSEPTSADGGWRVRVGISLMPAVSPDSVALPPAWSFVHPAAQ
jgi:hypothetical protein